MTPLGAVPPIVGFAALCQGTLKCVGLANRYSLTYDKSWDAAADIAAIIQVTIR